MARLNRVGQVVGQVISMAQLSDLAGGGTGRAQDGSAPQDRGRKDNPQGDAADEPPPEPGPSAVIGGLLDVQHSVLAALDDSHAVDGDGAALLDRLQALVGPPS